jgi:hypothetical protein
VTREHFDGRVRRVPAQMWAALSSRPCSGQAAIAGPQLHVACAGKLSETDVVRARRRGAHQAFPYTTASATSSATASTLAERTALEGRSERI